MNRALVVVDTQREYGPAGRIPIVHPPLATSITNVVKAMRAATAAGVPVVVVRQVSPAGAWACAADSPTTELLPEVAALPNDHVVDKVLPSAFPGTGLDAWLRAREIDRVAVVGYMTQNCVESTVRDAAHLGYSVEVLADATGTVGLANGMGELTAREVHESALVVMASRFAAVGSTSDWCRAVAGNEAWPQPDLSASVRPGPRLASSTAAAPAGA